MSTAVHQNPSKLRINRRLAVTLLAVAIALLACVYYAQRLTAWLAYDDEGGYLYAAWRISLGEAPYRDFITPQLPVFLYPGAAVLALSGYSTYAARFSMILYTVLASLTLFWIVRRLWGDGIALVTLVLCLAHEESFWAARFFRPEAPMLFWGLVGLALLVASYPQRRRLGLAAAGVALGLATMSKLFGALMMAGVGIFVLAEGVRTRDWRDMLHTGLWLAVPYLCIVLGFTAAFSLVSPDFVAAVLGHHLRQGSGMPVPQVIDKGLILYWDYVRTQPVLWALAVVGIVASLHGAPERRAFVWQLPTLLAFLAMTRELQARHFTYAVPSIVACAAVGLGWLLTRGAQSWHWRGSRGVLGIVGAALIVAVLVPQLRHNAMVAAWTDTTTPEWATYVDSLTQPDDVVISDYPGINYYARRPSTRLAAGISRGAAKSGQITGAALIAEIEQSQAKMVLLNVAQGAHQFANLQDYEAFKRYVQEHFYLIERKQYDYRLMEVYLRDDLWPGDRRQVLLGHDLMLTGVQWVRQQVAPGEQAQVLLRWQGQADMDVDYAVTLRLLDDAGQEWGLGSKSLVDIDRETYWDERGLEQPVLVPTSKWPLHETTIGNYELPIEVGTPPGSYRVVVRVHPKDSWAGLAVVDESGAAVGYDLLLGEVQVTGSPDQAQVTLEVPYAAPASYAPGLTLLGSDAPGHQVRPGDALSIALYWAVDDAHQAEQTLTFWIDDAGHTVLYHGALLGPNAEPALIVTPAQLRGQYLLKVPAEIDSGNYTLYLGAGDEAEPQIVLGTLQVAGEARVFTAPPMEHAVGATAEGVAVLLGHDHAGSAQPGGQAQVTLYWQCVQKVDVSYTVFVHLLDSSEHVWAQHDSAPANGESPTTSWVAGQVVADMHVLTIPPEMPAGEYHLEVGLYNAETGARVPLYGADGARLANDRLLLDVVQVIEP
ncbi:MAG: phospholipid carrier-dependent glycosyltransferase [Anaerolineales bacterium]